MCEREGERRDRLTDRQTETDRDRDRTETASGKDRN